ncbi:MAG: sensor histidine kinase [Solirubrobacterales bacterium]
MDRTPPPQLATELVDLLDGSLGVEDFVATVVHEAAQPLTAIQVLATALRTAGDSLDSDQRTEMLIEIENQAQFLRELSNWMLTPFGRETVLFDELVERTVARASSVAPDHELVVKTDAAEVLVTCETIRLEASIRNLIKNSAANAAPGSEIVVRTFARDDLALVTVCDSGTGIAEDDWESIFQPYHQLGSDRELVSGLGLFIVRSFAVRHGGHARVAASSPEGTTMEIALRALTPTDDVA